MDILDGDNRHASNQRKKELPFNIQETITRKNRDKHQEFSKNCVNGAL